MAVPDSRPAAAPLRILMVCMGNICRSPTAEAVLRERLRLAGLDEWVEVDSAGTHDYHVGRPPDERAIRHAAKRGLDLSGLRARRVTARDFEEFDRIYAMDEDNLFQLQCLEPDRPRATLALLLSVIPPGRGARGFEVPDPYTGSARDFERVLDLTEQAAEAIVVELRAVLADR